MVHLMLSILITINKIITKIINRLLHNYNGRYLIFLVTRKKEHKKSERIKKTDLHEKIIM